MAKKYSDLPDIEQESADVFETSDVESEIDESFGPNLGKQAASDDVEEEAIDPKNAKERFKNAVIEDDDELDFSGRISHLTLGNTGYRVKNIPETVEQKLTRISRELEEIKLASKDVSEEEKQETSVLLEKLQDLNKYLSGPEEPLHGELTKELFESTTNQLQSSKDIDAENTTANMVSPSTVMELESKINSIENLIGLDSPQSYSNLAINGGVVTLKSIVDDLGRKVNLIYNPEYNIEQVKRKIEDILEKTSTSGGNTALGKTSAHSVSPSTDSPLPSPQQSSEEKIDSLCRLLPELERLSVLAPHMFSRLRSLHSVHLDLAHSVSTIQNIDDTVYNLQNDLKKWDESINKVSKDLEKHSVVAEQNRKTIQDTVDALHDRVASLS